MHFLYLKKESRLCIRNDKMVSRFLTFLSSNILERNVLRCLVILNQDMERMVRSVVHPVDVVVSNRHQNQGQRKTNGQTKCKTISEDFLIEGTNAPDQKGVTNMNIPC